MKSKKNVPARLRSNEREKREKVVPSKSILDNVCERLSKLESKCGVNILDLPDSEILNKQKKEFKIIEPDFNKLLDSG